MDPHLYEKQCIQLFRSPIAINRVLRVVGAESCGRLKISPYIGNRSDDNALKK